MTDSLHPASCFSTSRAGGAMLAGTAALLLSACAGIAPDGAAAPEAEAATHAAPAAGAASAAPAAQAGEAAQAFARAHAATHPAIGASSDGGLDGLDTVTFFTLPTFGNAAAASPADAPSGPRAQAAAASEMLAVDGPSIRFKRKSRTQDDEEPDEASQGIEIDRGTASWYGLQFHGRRTANGERYNMYDLTAAHKSLPFNTIVSVKSLQTGRTVRVRINDRGPYVDGRVIDLSKAAADELGMTDVGIRPVSLTVEEWPDGTVPDAKGAKATRKRAVARSRH